MSLGGWSNGLCISKYHRTFNQSKEQSDRNKSTAARCGRHVHSLHGVRQNSGLMEVCDFRLEDRLWWLPISPAHRLGACHVIMTQFCSINLRVGYVDTGFFPLVGTHKA